MGTETPDKPDIWMRQRAYRMYIFPARLLLAAWRAALWLAAFIAKAVKAVLQLIGKAVGAALQALVTKLARETSVLKWVVFGVELVVATVVWVALVVAILSVVWQG